MKDYSQKKVSELSLDELKAATKQREDEEQREAVKKQEALNDSLMKHIDLLIELTPKHDYSSCSDTCKNFSSDVCTRCVLLEAKQCFYLDTRFRLEIRAMKTYLNKD
jgi:hypothetical protein